MGRRRFYASKSNTRLSVLSSVLENGWRLGVGRYQLKTRVDSWGEGVDSRDLVRVFKNASLGSEMGWVRSMFFKFLFDSIISTNYYIHSWVGV